MGGKRYSAQERLFVRENAWRKRKELHEMFVEKFRYVSQDSLTCLCKNNGWRCGFGGRDVHPIGSLIPKPGGYSMIKLTRNTYARAHVFEWEKENGPIPHGFILRCRTEDRANPHPSNWMLLSRSSHTRINVKYGPAFLRLTREMQDLAVTSSELHLRASNLPEHSQ